MTHRKIIQCLTKPQRLEIIRGSFSGDFDIRTARALIKKGLMEHRITSPNGRYGPIINTELGNQVRDVLLGRHNNHENKDDDLLNAVIDA